METSGTTRHTCLKLEIPSDAGAVKDAFFVKGTWFDTHFNLDITDGLHAWTCSASESEARLRAEQWDQPVSEYVALAERYLGLQQPGSRYAFEDAGNGQRRLSWTFEKEGTKLEWRWKCQSSSDNKQTTAGILDFLMDANIRLSEEVVRKTQAFDKMKVEAERCLSQSEKFNNEKAEFESTVYAKFVTVLNSKKAKLRELRDQAKLRELRDQISKVQATGKARQEDDESTDKTVSFDEGSDEKIEEPVEDLPAPSEDVATSSSKGRKRRGRK